MTDFRVRCEVDLELPEPGRYAEQAARWLDQGSAELAGPYRRAIEEGPALSADSVRRPGPAGPPGSVWGFFTVARMGPRGERRTSRVFGRKNLPWFLEQLADPPQEATAGISILDDDGYPDESPLRISVQREDRAPGWLRLVFEAPERDLLEPAAQQGWLRFVRETVEALNPSFGLIDYAYGLGRTAVEETVGPPWRTPGTSIPLSRELLRGYGWLTICAEELADKLGGAEALGATGSFHEVAQLDAGGVWLLATADYRDYDERATERVFRALAPVLPPGTPVHREPTDGQGPYRIVHQDAAEVR